MARLLLFIFSATLFLSACKSGEKAASSAKHSKELSSKEQKEFSYLFFNATKEKLIGNFELAGNLFQQALKVDPHNGAANYEMAAIWNFKGNAALALEYSKRAIAADPNNVWYQLIHAECLLNDGQDEKAIAVYKKIIEKHPENIDHYYDLANAYVYMKRFKEAVEVFDQLEEKIGMDDELMIQKITLYQQMGDAAKAETEIQKLIAAYPEEIKYLELLGELYLQTNQRDKAFEVYQQILEKDPDNPGVHLSLADYYRDSKQEEKAFEELQLAFKNAYLDIDTKVKILLSYYTITETFPELKEQALTLCEILTEVHGNDAKSFSIYGDFLYRDRKLEPARDAFRKAIALDKERYPLWNQLVLIDSELSDFKAMADESEEALEYFPNQPSLYLLNGAANLQLKKYEEAIEVLNNGLNYVIDNRLLLAQFYAHLGDAYHYTEDHVSSDEYYDKNLSLDPGNSYVLNNYSYYLSLRKDKLEQAKKMSKKANDLVPNNSSYQDTYAWIVYQLKEYEEARVWIEKALANGGESSGVIVEHYGDILFQLGDVEKAISFWKKAKELGGATEFIDKKIADKKLYE